MMSNFVDWENIIHFGNIFGSIGKKTYFLALGTTPIKGVGFIAGKITDAYMYFNIFQPLVCKMVTRLLTPSIILAGRALLVKMLITLSDFIWIFLPPYN